MSDAIESTACPRCGAMVPGSSRYCGSCGASVSQDPITPTVGAAVARTDRLSDSGALQLRQLLMDATAGDYEIQGELGRGGMAVVYTAFEIHLARRVAIKILPPELTFTRGAAERFQREARTAAALDHPNIIPIYRISSGGRLFWYAMKFLEGRSLAEILQEKGLLTVGETVAILDQVGTALDYAHQRHVVHRDVKPGNVMLDVDGRVTVTDFGIAKELTGGALTGSGAILGTPYYMSPEQCRGGADITGAADQYSLGVMAYQMVCGQLPFEADSAIDVIHKHVAEQPAPLDQILPGLPKHVINAINRAMSKKAPDRFPTVQAFVNALKNAPAEVTLVMDAKRGPSQVSRRSTVSRMPAVRGSAKRVAVGFVVIGTLVSGVLYMNNRMTGVAEPTSAIRPPAGPTGAPGQASNPPAPGPETTPGRTGSPPTQTRVTPPRTAPNPTAPGAARASGRVRISIAPTYATITIAGRTIADRRGWADSLPAGTYPLTVTREGYATVTRNVTVSAGRETVIEVTLQPRSQP